MAVTRKTEGGVEYLEGADPSLAVAIDYSAQITGINDTLADLVTETSGVKTALESLLAESKIANGHFANMVLQITRLANCTCTPCSNVDMCEVVEKVLREDGVIA